MLCAAKLLTPVGKEELPALAVVVGRYPEWASLETISADLIKQVDHAEHDPGGQGHDVQVVVTDNASARA